MWLWCAEEAVRGLDILGQIGTFPYEFACFGQNYSPNLPKAPLENVRMLPTPPYFKIHMIGGVLVGNPASHTGFRGFDSHICQP